MPSPVEPYAWALDTRILQVVFALVHVGLFKSTALEKCVNISNFELFRIFRILIVYIMRPLCVLN